MPHHNRDFSSFFGLLGNSSYYKPLENYKEYYASVPYLNSVINEIVNVTSQVNIKEVYIDDGTEVENSDYVNLLKKPNRWQGQDTFIAEATINMLTQGACIQWSDYFANGNLKRNAQLYNLNTYSLLYPKVDGLYWNYTNLDKKNLVFQEYLPNGKLRNIPVKELNIVYDTINHSLFGRDSNHHYTPEMFLCPISRIESLRYDLQIIINSNESLASLSDAPVMGILSKKQNGAQNAGAQIAEMQKSMIEANLDGRGDYGAKLGGKGKFIATNESLEYLNLVPNLKATIEAEILSQNNSKENIRTAFGVPKDIHDATSGERGGSTFENQSIAEARFVTVTCANITDKILDGLTDKSPLYFSKDINGSNKTRPTKLIGDYDHLPSVIDGRDKKQIESVKAQTEALNNFLDAGAKAKELGIELNLTNYLIENGFEDLLKK